MKQIPLTKGFSAIVDDDLFEYLNRWKWHYNDGYAERKEFVDGKQIHIRMHQAVMESRITIDHINGDRLDNRKSNLRFTNHSTNAMNMRKSLGKSSIYKGVSKQNNGWRTQIILNQERVFSAMFPTELQAAMAYDINAPVYFGEFARLNFPTALGRAVKTADALHE